LALQQVDASHLGSSSVNTPVAFDTGFRLTGQLAPSVQDLSPGPRSHGNALAFVMIGTTLPASGLSVGGSVRWAKLRAVDGVDLLNIPQDPGHAAAYELGVGVSRTYGPSLFGMDVVYQPIWSTAWAEAGTPAATLGSDTSRFHFSNVLFRMGVSREVTLGPLTR